MSIIYKTTNLLNNKIYIGQSNYNDPTYYGSGKWLKRSIKKYGKENFRKETIEECNEVELNEREIYWINFYQSNKFGYNISRGGQKGWMIGLKHSEETKKKISELNKGEKNSFYGKHHTEETKRKISESNKGNASFLGKHHTEETKKRLSDLNKGKKLTDEAKEKIKIASTGRKHTEEWKKMISKLHKGKNVSLETREKMKNNNIGKKLSSTTKSKIGESLEKEVLKIVDNIVVNQWRSPADASLELKITIKSIRYYCRKKNTTNRYNLIYKNDYDKTTE